MFAFASYKNVDLIEPARDNGVGSIHLGNWQSVKDFDYLHKHKITHVVTALPKSLCELKELSKFGIVQHQVPCEDSPEFNILPMLNDAADFIQDGLSKGNVLVHCAAGISRSTTCLIAYYIKHRKMEAEAALAFVRQKRSCASPNFGFLKALKQFEKNQVS